MRGLQRYLSLAAGVVSIAAASGAFGADVVSADPDSQASRAAAPSAAKAPTAHAARVAELKAQRTARLRPGGRIEFGIYPGGGAGAVNGRGEPRPEIPALRQQALDQLRGGTRPFVVHLYDAYTGPSDVARTPQWLRTQIDDFTAKGLRVELVLRYRPAVSGGDVPGYLRFVRSRVKELGPNANITSLQIGNEANVTAAPDAADGAYPGASRALVKGVVAARTQARRSGAAQLAVGFNWANEGGPAARAFFARLAREGGKAFAASVDWVGVDAYPGTWGPQLPDGDLATAVRKDTATLLHRLRSSLLPAAGLRRAPIVIAESGYPTDQAQRTEADQVAVMNAAVGAVVSLRKRYGVVGYRWFDLRDADSSVPSFESRYGLMRDDYSPKAGFMAYRDLVARHG